MTGALPLLQALETRAAESPDAVALVEPTGRPVTRRALAARVRGVADGLVASGMVPGDHVLFGIRPSVDAITWMLGVVAAGGVLVAADLGVGDSVFAAQVAASRPRWVIAESLLLAASRSAVVRRLARARGLSLLPPGALEATRRVRVGRWLPGVGNAVSERAVVRAGRGTPVHHPEVDDEAPAIVVFTSGTTAAPKGVVHSRRSIGATLDLIGGQLGFGADDVLYSRDVHLILPALVAGARAVVAPSGRFDAGRMVAALEAQQVTHFFAVTAEARTLAEWLTARGRRLPARVREVMVGAAPVRVDFLRAFQSVLPDGARAWCVYGMTELLPAAWVTLEEKLAFTGDGDLVGTPARGVAVRTTDAGELVVAGDNLFTGYLGHPPVHEHPTGDLARIERGRIVLLGRAKDMIIRGRYNIYPELHEPVIERIPGVRRCAMIGVFDEERADECIVLVVEPDAEVEEDELLRRVQHAVRAGASVIDESAAPDLVRLDALPVIGRSGKVDKQALRARARAWLE